MLVGERGAYRLAKPPDAWQVPATVQAILAARIDRLPPEDKRLLQAAAVIGKDVPFALLQAIAGRVRRDAAPGLAHLQAAEFLYETSLFPDLEYTFKHALTHEVAYGSLLQDVGARSTPGSSTAIETLHADRLTEQVERLAHHAFRGELWEQGRRPTSGRPARRPSRARQPRGGRRLRAGAGRAGPSSRRRARPWSKASTSASPSATRSGPSAASRSASGTSRTPERLATALDDRRRLGWIAAYLSEHTRQTGHVADAPPFAERALTIARGVDDLQLAVAANYYLGSAYFVAGDYRRVDEYFSEILRATRG